MLRKALLVCVTALVLALLTASTLAADCPCTIDTLASGGGAALGDSANTEVGEAQTFVAPGNGQVSAFQVKFNANVGSPTGDATWVIAGDYLGQPGATITTGTFTPVASNTVNVTVNDGVNLNSGGMYWITFRVPNQATDSRYIMTNSTTSTYANGTRWLSNNGAAWTPSAANDLYLIMTIGAVSSTSTPASTATPANTATPTATFTPTVTNTPDYFQVATFAAATGYPITIRPTATMGEVSVSGLLIVLILLLGVLGIVWFLRR
jgi:hypothetical protein